MPRCEPACPSCAACGPGRPARLAELAAHADRPDLLLGGGDVTRWPDLAAFLGEKGLGDPIFREREVPRMLQLATARRRRHQRARRADELSRPQQGCKKREIAGWQNCRIAGLIDH